MFLGAKPLNDQSIIGKNKIQFFGGLFFSTIADAFRMTDAFTMVEIKNIELTCVWYYHSSFYTLAEFVFYTYLTPSVFLCRLSYRSYL